MKKLDFAAFFRDIHGVPPLPWQARLARLLTEHHEWPDVIDLPTASGKTACVDIALFHLAWCTRQGEPWKAARRIVFVVDRRIVVDAAAERAERIRTALEEKRSEEIRSVAETLQQLGGDLPLRCQKLRGGMAREPSFALNPAQPLIITSTIDQIGSRLLFRGYGLSPYAAPLHAGLLGHDTLVLLDEAHLGEPFAATVSAVAREQARAERPLSPLRPIRLVLMSATARAGGARFRLDGADLAHPMMAERRTAPKPVHLVETTHKPAERLKALRQEALAIFGQIEAQAAAVAVIVNRVRTARALFEQLSEQAGERTFDIELMIGRSRPLDRDRVAGRVVARAGANLPRQSAKRGLIVVATQTIEVGADLDFQGMVTECAALDALMQRFGRLDRLGRFRKARAVIVGGGEDDDDPIYGAALAKTWRWLNSIATLQNERPCVNFSIEAMETSLRNADVQTLMGTPRARLELAPAFVELLCQTAPAPAHQPDVAALLHGLDSAPPDVQIVWRADLPVRRARNQMLLDPRKADVARELLDINPPSSLEALSLPVYAARAWLENSGREPPLVDVEGAAQTEEPDERGETTLPRQAWRRNPDGWQAVFAGDIRPGDTVVVPAAYGGCDEFGFAPDSQAPVRDLSAAARKALERSPLLIVTDSNVDSISGVDPQAASAAWGRVRDAYREKEPPPEELLNMLLESLGDTLRAEYPWLERDAVVDLVAAGEELEPRELHALIVTSRRVSEGDISDEDLSSSRTVPVTLEAHNAGVGERARILAEAVAMNPQHVRNLEHAGQLHDIGKADPRFQTLLRAGDYSTLKGRFLAKGLRRAKAQRVELGERHEAYSVALLKMHESLLSMAPDPELALYLVGTHHGRGRALMPDRVDDGAAFAIELGGTTYSFDGAPRLGALGSDWATLFWRMNRRYGPWGIAYLEAVLRLADQLRSAEELRGGTRP